MSPALLLVALSTFFFTIRAEDDTDISVAKIFGLVIGGISIIIAVLICIACYRVWARSKRSQKFSTFKDTQVVTTPLSPPPPASERSPIYNLGYGPTFNTSGPFFPIQSTPIHPAVSQLPNYPSSSGYIQENPMTITQQYSCQAGHTNVATTVAPLASLESITHEDLSDSSIYRRFFCQEADISPIKPPVTPIPPSSQQDSTSRTRKISLAFRDAVRVFKFGSMSGLSGQQQEDTITLEDGTTTTSSSLPQTPGNIGHTRLFKQQKKPKISIVSRGGMKGGGSRIGRRSKNATSSQDSGHCSSFEIAETEDIESSIDNDRFLHSLESAVFTPTPISTGGSNDGTASHYFSSSTLNDGDLEGGEFGGSSAGGSSLYPPLPPGSPVIGFAYLGLGDVQEEDDMVQRIDDGESREEIDPRGSASTLGTDLARAGTPPIDDGVQFCNGNHKMSQNEPNQRNHNSSDSATSTTVMISTSRGQRQSLSASDIDLRPLGTNTEPWLAISDENLLISSTGDYASRSKKRGGFSVYSKDHLRPQIDLPDR